MDKKDREEIIKAIQQLREHIDQHEDEFVKWLNEDSPTVSESGSASGYVAAGWLVYLEGVGWGFFANKDNAERRKEELLNNGATIVAIKQAFIKAT